jgi:ubiquinone/menaquinone biosynthesis C-methylase UbiE
MKWWPIKKRKKSNPVRPAKRKREGAGQGAVARPALEADPTKQDLDLYWDPKMADILETWGEAHVWKEVRLLFWQSRGKVLDIACGTGRTMEILASNPDLEVHGCDISDLLIGRAEARGLSGDRLKVADATNLSCYESGAFRHSYSIGSLEHFTEEGIAGFVRESHRVTTGFSAHMIPLSRSGEDEGWMKTVQSFFNNSEAWWRAKFETHYDRVVFLPSGWHDKISVGTWILCEKSRG